MPRRGLGRRRHALRGNITSGSHFRVLAAAAAGNGSGPAPPCSSSSSRRRRPHEPQEKRLRHNQRPRRQRDRARRCLRRRDRFFLVLLRQPQRVPVPARSLTVAGGGAAAGPVALPRFLRAGRFTAGRRRRRGRVPVSLDAPRAIAAPHQPRSLGAFAQLVQQALPPKPPSPRPGGGAELSARLGLAGEESEDEGAGSGVTAIDNKIERAMDLVKSHLLLAVREEVEALREQIRELSERRAALERENRLLRALATPQQLARLHSPQPPGPPSGPS
ncbi:TSC22 domain family protein 4-like [Corvus cornix cornix]|uniref:TSC22 domain family protein 4-like n=1 Tax=Corvus cornix cornix TaxID=932674 RepID=UPI00194DF83D|nr:TSC22 domain family protein 4-like [Corvus cornix cornix]